MEDARMLQLRRRLAAAQEESLLLLQRALGQIEFARGLCGLHPDRADAWTDPIDAALGEIEGGVHADASRLSDAVARVESALSPLAATAKRYTVHCLGHAHIDMNWMWSWPETVAVTNDTFATVLRLMEEFDDFCFTQSQASVYAIVRDHCPCLWEPIRRRIAEGRWEVAAAHWVEGDKNLASGESLARHLLYTRRFFREQFDLAPDDQPLDWEPDTFGHAATIPSIVSRGAVRRYYFCRGGTFDKPTVFWWRGPDGARILVNRETTWYNDRIGPHNVLGLLAFCAETGLRDWLCVYGVGDHGGGPTRRDLLLARKMDAWPVYPNVRLATSRRYFEILEAEGDRWQELEGELNFEFSGCYTSQAWIKRTNRLAESGLESAEAAAALAARAAGLDYPRTRLRRAWTDTLFGHFHDILPGTGVRATRDEHMGRFSTTAATMGVVRTESLRAVARRIDTTFAAGEAALPAVPPSLAGLSSGAGAGRGTALGGDSTAGHAAEGPRAFVVLNPTAQPRRETVTVTVWDAGEGVVGRKRFGVRFPDETRFDAQELSRGRFWGHDYVDLAVPVEAGPLGWSSFAIEQVGEDAGPPSDRYPARRLGEAPQKHDGVRFEDPFVLENTSLRVRLDERTGGAAELVDKASGRDLADAVRPMAILEHVLERAVSNSAWRIGQTRRVDCPLELTKLETLRRGPISAAVRARLRVGESDVTVTYALHAGERCLRVRVAARWLERGGPEVGVPSLRLRLPTCLSDAAARYEIPFGWIDRDLRAGQEVPALRWANVTGRDAAHRPAGLLVVNDCKHGHSLDGDTLRVTLLRSTFTPDPLPEIGDHEMSFALGPHDGSMTPAEAMAEAGRINHPLSVVATDASAGALPSRLDGAAVSPEGVVLTGLKLAEDADALIVRLLETVGRAATARVDLSEELFGEVAAVEACDLLERPAADTEALRCGNGFEIKLGARALASVRVRFA